MLRFTRKIVLTGFAVSWLCNSYAASVVWPAVNLGEGGMWAGTHYVSSDISNAGYVAVLMALSSSSPAYATVSAVDYFTGNQAVWFETTLNQPIDANAEGTTLPFCDNSTGALGAINVTRNVPFYIGFVIDGGEPGPIYGWASIYWNGTTLVLLDSAAETTGVGIYAGTYTPMPEPSAAGLALAGLAALALRRRTARGAVPTGGGDERSLD